MLLNFKNMYKSLLLAIYNFRYNRLIINNNNKYDHIKYYLIDIKILY